MNVAPSKDSPSILNVGAVLRSSSNPLLRRLPRWVIRPIAQLLYEKEFNESLHQCTDLYGFDWVNGMLRSFNIAVVATNEHNIKRCGRAVFVPNHTIGGLDGMAVLSVIGRYHAGAKSLSSDFLMAIPNVASFIIPVSTSGSKSRDFVAKVDALYASDEQVLCFAAGQVSQLTEGKIADLPWSKSFVMKAIQYERSVVPVHISTCNRPSFYRHQKLRRTVKRLTGLSIERFFILREQHHQRNNTIHLNFGRPIPYTVFDQRGSADAWAQAVRAHVYRMGPDTDPPFEGVPLPCDGPR
jgi:putative hemolysin